MTVDPWLDFSYFQLPKYMLAAYVTEGAMKALIDWLKYCIKLVLLNSNTKSIILIQTL